MIPFDLERAKKGVPMITRGRCPAKFIALLEGGQPAPLVVEIKYPMIQGIHREEMENYFLTGRHCPPHDSYLDLFMEY